MTNSVRIIEVGPRDGFQFEEGAKDLTPAEIVKFIDRLVATGLQNIEIGSFASPEYVPQMAGTAEVVRLVKEKITSGKYSKDIRFSVLAVNERYAKEAFAAGVDSNFEMAVVVAATESFAKKNLGCKDIEDCFQKGAAILKLTQQENIKTRAYISTIFRGVQPREGEAEFTKPEVVADLAKRLLAEGAYEVSLGDTTGVGTVADVMALDKALQAAGVPRDKVVWHFHDTHGRAIDNARRAHEMGYRNFDSAAGGLGGCKFSGSQVGNLATEDLVSMFHDMKIKTGVNLNRLVLASMGALTRIKKVSPSPIYKKLMRVMLQGDSGTFKPGPSL